jgi:hypothetical protein
MDSIAVAQAWIAVGAILGKKSRFSQRWVPRCVHTDPLIASVGWTEEEAGRAGLSAIAQSETFRLITEDEKSVFDPVPEAMSKREVRSISQEELLAFLLNTRSYPHRPKRIRLKPTHGSFVLLAAPYVYKVRKPVNFGFLDFSTLEKRHYFSEISKEDVCSPLLNIRGRTR